MAIVIGLLIVIVIALYAAVWVAAAIDRSNRGD